MYPVNSIGGTYEKAAQGIAQGAKLVTPSVSNQADTALEEAAKARYAIESLFCELKQLANGQTESFPCRSGLDGKMQDAADHSRTTSSFIAEIRAYLLG